MEDPATLRLKGKCNRIQKKLDRLISIQFALQKKILMYAIKSVEEIEELVSKVLERLREIHAANVHTE